MKTLTCKSLLILCSLATASWAVHFEKLSLFERELAQKAFEKYDLILDPNPDNKKIKDFYFYTEDPFNTFNTGFHWLNWFHNTTQDQALKNQIWILPGDTYNPAVIIQNQQALLNPLVRSMVLILPVQRKNKILENQVDLLVISKDIFSWQGNTLVSSAGSTLTNLYMSMSQTNLLGLNKTVSASFNLDQALINLSASYLDPALFSTKNQLTFTQGVYLKRDGFGYEGINTYFELSYPLGTENTPWAYSLNFKYLDSPFYDFQGNHMRQYEGYNRQYHQQKISPSLNITRSFGTTYKNNIGFGYGANLYQYTPLEEVSQKFRDNVLPYSEFQSFLQVDYDYFQNQFLTLHDYNTFSMSEWIQLGPYLSVTNHIALEPILRSEHTFWSPTVLLGGTVSPTQDSFINTGLQLGTRFQDNSWKNNLIYLSSLVIFPRLWEAGRFVFRTGYGKSWDNLDHDKFFLGGDSGLRGTPYRYDSGNQVIKSNLEFRTSSLEFWIFRLGLVSFYDFGSAFDNQYDFNLTHDLGLGLRILLIPWNRLLIRIDGAIPVAGPLAGIQNTLVTVGVGQAF